MCSLNLKQKLEIQNSYKKLIDDCKNKIGKGIDVNINKIMLNEYLEILNKFQGKVANDTHD